MKTGWNWKLGKSPARTGVSGAWTRKREDCRTNWESSRTTPNPLWRRSTVKNWPVLLQSSYVHMDLILSVQELNKILAFFKYILFVLWSFSWRFSCSWCLAVCLPCPVQNSDLGLRALILDSGLDLVKNRKHGNSRRPPKRVLIFWWSNSHSVAKHWLKVKSFKVGTRATKSKKNCGFFSLNLLNIPRDIPWHHWKNLLTSKRGRSGGFNFFT